MAERDTKNPERKAGSAPLSEPALPPIGFVKLHVDSIHGFATFGELKDFRTAQHIHLNETLAEWLTAISAGIPTNDYPIHRIVPVRVFAEMSAPEDRILKVPDADADWKTRDSLQRLRKTWEELERREQVRRFTGAVSAFISALGFERLWPIEPIEPTEEVGP